MNDKRKEEIRKDDKKHGKRFILIILLSLLAGALLGWGVVTIIENGTALSFFAMWIVPVIADVIMWIALLVGFPLSRVYLKRGKKLAAAVAAEEEGAEVQMDHYLNLSLTIITALQVIVYTGCGMVFSIMGSMQQGLILTDTQFMVPWFTALLALILALVLGTAISQQTVNFMKEQNPEKQGSVFQINFNKVWLNSCDEAEKAQAYEAAFRAYRVGVYACMLVWMISCFTAMLGWTNWITSLLLGIVWGALQISYCVFCLKKNSQSVSGAAG